MARIQTAIRPGTTVTLAPRTPAVVTTYTNVPVPVSHVPKGNVVYFFIIAGILFS